MDDDREAHFRPGARGALPGPQPLRSTLHRQASPPVSYAQFPCANAAGRFVNLQPEEPRVGQLVIRGVLTNFWKSAFMASLIPSVGLTSK